MYPELRIARVEQAAQAIPMERWCGGTRGGRCAHPHHQVVPFRCLRESQAGGGEQKQESLRDKVLSPCLFRGQFRGMGASPAASGREDLRITIWSLRRWGWQLWENLTLMSPIPQLVNLSARPCWCQKAAGSCTRSAWTSARVQPGGIGRPRRSGS